MRPRVFVSSVMEGFKDNREAARAAIIAAGGQPVLIEDQVGVPHSPRNACLDAVASCDFSIIVVGERGGYVTPSGKLVVEEEYEEAKRRKLPILIFIQSGPKDDLANTFVKKVSDYVEGFFRKTFNNATDLEKVITETLHSVIKSWGRPKVDLSIIEDRLDKPYSIPNETSLRFVLSPELTDEIIDPVTLESEDFENELLEIGHSSKVKLFSYAEPKSKEIEINGIVILQGAERIRRTKTDVVRLEITHNGEIIVDLNVTGRIRDDYQTFSYLVILESDIILALQRCFAFVGAFFEHKDKFKRYDRMYYNVGLNELSHRQIVKELPKGSSCSMSMRQDKSIKAFEKPRPIFRADLLNSDNEINTVITLFRRRSKS